MTGQAEAIFRLSLQKEHIRQIAGIIKNDCADQQIPVPRILMEPGRSIVADSGITLYTVGSVKTIPGLKNYVSVDGGMTDNPRYTLYQSRYTIRCLPIITQSASLPLL